MKGRLTILTLVLFSLSVAPLNKGLGISQNNSQLLEVGEFHGDEVMAQSGEKWLGLHITDENSMLVTYRVTVKAVEDPVLDQGPDQKTGKAVGVDLPLEPLFLIKGVGTLREGPVSTVFDGSTLANLTESSPLNLNLGEASYVLKVTGSEDTAKCSDQLLPRNARLVLVHGESRQVLYSLEGCGDDASWSLVWAGDLDKDGKLDIYVNVTQHYNVTERKLFLSSQAAKDQLVKKVAEFVTSGC